MYEVKKVFLFLTIICIVTCIYININHAGIKESTSTQTKNPVVTVVFSNDKTIKIELYPDKAPNTVNNFIYLINHHFYDNLPINKIVPGYIIQMGDPIGDSTGFPGYFIKSECKNSSIRKPLKHTKGVVSMCRGKEYHTEGSQLFILLTDDPSLDGRYTSFGKVVEGMDVLEDIGNPINTNHSMKKDILIKNMYVETFGIHYDEPEIISIREKLNSNY